MNNLNATSVFLHAIVCSSPLTGYQITFGYIDFIYQFFYISCDVLFSSSIALLFIALFITVLLCKLVIFTYPGICFVGCNFHCFGT